MKQYIPKNHKEQKPFFYGYTIVNYNNYNYNINNILITIVNKYLAENE